ncbi:hypothetical protein MiAbW_03608 [Microcystis aeruginosa NIES-4325]|uniref:Winged helix-turn helix domain-containing protein n=1 Tax=Microcystis aeruginosa NIES-4325 TaxID=2569534 RepID=A0A5J4FCI3_MICAE|nr:hypothetical protein MiAbW_03608 [Microcystis aeruginosa NIES-4325]
MAFWGCHVLKCKVLLRDSTFLINLLLKIVDEDPKEFGYEFGRWTAARLAEHLEKETGIKLSGSQVRRILRRKKYVYIWAKYSLEDNQDKELRKAFKGKLYEYLKLGKEKPESIQVWFWDGAVWRRRFATQPLMNVDLV